MAKVGRFCPSLWLTVGRVMLLLEHVVRKVKKDLESNLDSLCLFECSNVRVSYTHDFSNVACWNIASFPGALPPPHLGTRLVEIVPAWLCSVHMEALTHSRMAVEIPLYVFNEEERSGRQSKEPIVIHFKGCTKYSSLTYRCIKIEDLRELVVVQWF